MVDKYGVGQDPYTYKGTSVLRNKLEIKDEDELDNAERDLSELAAMDIEFSEPPYDLDYWCDLHRKLFSDVYDWAGDIREVDISKGDTRFCNVSFIQKEATRYLDKLDQENYLVGLDRDELISKLSWYYCELNVVHPFRDGNGRAQRLLFEHIAINCGYEISFESVEVDEWLEANVEGYLGDCDKMEKIFDKCIGQSL